MAQSEEENSTSEKAWHQLQNKLKEQQEILHQQKNEFINQQKQIDEQQSIINELAWQIRDLRNSVRAFSEKIDAKINICSCPSKKSCKNQLQETEHISSQSNSNSKPKPMPRLQRQNAKYDETIAPCDDDDNVKKDNIKNIENDTGSVDEVISRIKKFNDFSHRTERGSSKTLCSFVPNVEADYLPRSRLEADNEGENE